MKLLSPLILQFTHLNKDRTRQGFNDTANSMCPLRADVQATEYFLLCCHCFSTQRFELFGNLYRLNQCLLKLNTKYKVTYLLYGSTSNSCSIEKELLNLL